MHLNNRLRKLERTAKLTADGPYCKRCEDNNGITGWVTTICGEEQPGAKRVCEDCGRENPQFLNIMLATGTACPECETMPGNV
jgi:hypothetical protein